jgi:putative transposase
MPYGVRTPRNLPLGPILRCFKVRPVSRRLRLHVPGGFYHVTLRGNHRQAIFRTAGDRELLEEIVADSIRDLGANVHAYCWMTNHIHAIVQVADAPLGKLVLRIASQYARRFQARLETTGHLFERRYHAVLVEADRYLLTLVRYIHLNPVRAGLAGDPMDYMWSSHRAYLGLRQPEWLSTAFALRVLSSDPRKALVAYRKLMGDQAETRWGTGTLVPHPDNPQVLGSDKFLRSLDVTPRTSGHGGLEELMVECAERFCMGVDALSGNSRCHDVATARAWLVREAMDRGIASVSAVARRLHRSEAALRGLIARRARHAEE